jgi:hypothetical protein
MGVVVYSPHAAPEYPMARGHFRLMNRRRVSLLLQSRIVPR